MTVEDDTRKLVREALGAHFDPPPPGLHGRVRAAIQAEADGVRRKRRRVARRTWAVVRWPLSAVAVLVVLALMTAILVAPRLLAREGTSPARTPTSTPTARPIPTPTPYAQGPQNAILGDTSPGPNAPLASATSNGYGVLVTGAADDGATIALQFAVGSASSDVRMPTGSGPLALTVTDSKGQSLQTLHINSGSASESIGGIASAEWDAVERAPDGAKAGSPISLHITQLQILGATTTTNPSGDWSMTVTPTLSSDPTTALPLPASAKLGAATITFTSVRANHAYLEIRYEVAGVACPETNAKGCGAEPTVTGPGGVPVSSGPTGLPSRIAGLDGLSNTPPFVGAGDQLTLVQLASSPGIYTITITGDPGQTLTRTVDVPNGRAASVPTLPAH